MHGKDFLDGGPPEFRRFCHISARVYLRLLNIISATAGKSSTLHLSTRHSSYNALSHSPTSDSRLYPDPCHVDARNLWVPAIKKSKVPIHAAPWMDLGSTGLSERSQSKETTFHVVIPLNEV